MRKSKVYYIVFRFLISRPIYLIFYSANLFCIWSPFVLLLFFLSLCAFATKYYRR